MTVVLTVVVFVVLVEFMVVVTIVLVVMHILQFEGQKEHDDPLRKYPGAHERHTDELHKEQPNPHS